MLEMHKNMHFYKLLYALVLCYFYIILIFYYFALSTERTWFDYISLLVIPCIIYYVTNKETLNLEPWTLKLFELKCVFDSVCTQPPYKDKDPPSFFYFLNLIK